MTITLRAQGGEGTCPGSHRQAVAEPGSLAGRRDSPEPHLLTAGYLRIPDVALPLLSCLAGSSLAVHPLFGT